VGGEFALTDHFGRRVTHATYHGRFVLIFFGFSHCKVVCPRALARISGALERIDANNGVQPLYITVDPARDTPEVLRAFLESRFPRFTGLTGSTEEIDAVKAAFRVFARRTADPQNPTGYDMPHTALTYLIDPRGRYRVHFADTIDEADLAERLRLEIAGNGI
jgi:protein SCO1/2